MTRGLFAWYRKTGPFDRMPCACLLHGEGAFVEHGASSDVQECVDADASDGAHDAREEPSVVDDDVVATLVVAVVAAEVPAGDLCGKIEIRLSPWIFQILRRKPSPFAQHPIVLLVQSITRSLKGSLLEGCYP